MGINLLNIEPHKVSKDLSGYITTKIESEVNTNKAQPKKVED